MSIEPIRRHVTVRCDPATAFRVFTTEMDTWWPLHIHSRAAGTPGVVKAERIVVEEHAGGRIYEVMSDGVEADWGTILIWEPPQRLVIAWQPNGGPHNPTELELRFVADSEGTRVDLEHRGWERLGPEGGEARESYLNGWPLTFDRLFAEAADDAAQ